MTAADGDEIAMRADKLYAARSALAETARPTRRLGIGEIVQFLHDPERSLTMDEQRALFADPLLRADYRRLKAQATVSDLPALAAASAGVSTAVRCPFIPPACRVKSTSCCGSTGRPTRRAHCSSKMPRAS